AALGISPLNQASDGGGSIRVPAACCGVFGLKPSRARISLGPLLGEDWGGLDVAGPITRTVGDAALFLDVTAGPATGDPYWAPPPARSFLSAVDERRPMRIAVAYERDGENVDPETIDRVSVTAALLRSLGHTVEDASPSLLPLEGPYLLTSTIGIGVLDLTAEQLELLEPRTRIIFDAARSKSAVAYVRALNDMHRQARIVAEFFETYDALLTPTLSRPAPPIGEIGADIEHAWDDYRNWLCWTWPFNATGQPAASVPAGFSSDGLPIGVQIVGRQADERTVLSLAAQLERARPWIDHRPPIW
ncbi:MAG: amidase, partial [Actinomycetota bacterium]